MFQTFMDEQMANSTESHVTHCLQIMDGADGTVRVKPGRVLKMETDVAVSSPVTRQKAAAAAKQFIKNHKNCLQGLHERMERHREFKRKSHQFLKSVDSRFRCWDTCYSSTAGSMEDISKTDSSDSDEEDGSDTDVSKSDLDDNDEELKVTDPNGHRMVYPSRSEVLNRLPAGLPERLKLSLIGLITNESAITCVGDERFRLLQATNPTEHLFIHDSKGRIYIFWKTGQLYSVYILDEAARTTFKGAAGFIRDQHEHVICWAFGVCDLISICRVLYGWDEDFQPLSARYLCENLEPQTYQRDIGSSKHRCYGAGHINALFYAQKHGITADTGDESSDFDCRKKCTSEGIKYGIRNIFRYPTLRDALVRLKTHPVIAALICFEGWDNTNGIYRGPYHGGSYMGKHTVILIDCTEFEGEIVVICKSSNGRETGKDGYLLVSVEVMLMAVAATRHSSRPDRLMCDTDPTHLLCDFYSIDMEMGPHPMIKEDPGQVEENDKFAIRDGRDSDSEIKRSATYRICQQSKKERDYAAEQSAKVTEACWTLTKRLSRAMYIMKLNGINVNEEETTTDPTLLMEIMELREAISEAEDSTALNQIRSQVQEKLKQWSDSFVEASESQRFDEAVKCIQRMTCYERACEEIVKKL